MIRKMLQVLVVTIILFGLYGSASAADNHWLGTAGDNWEGNYERTAVHVIGRDDLNNSNYFFTGMIDEVRFWGDRARTQSEIQEYMSRGLTGDEEGLVGYWKFNKAEGTIAYDNSPNGNNGTISDATWTTDAPPVAP